MAGVRSEVIRNVGIIGHPGAADGLNVPQDVQDMEVLMTDAIWEPRWMRAMPSGYVHWVLDKPRRTDYGDSAPTACKARSNGDPKDYLSVWGFTRNFPPLATRCPLCLRLTYDKGAA